MEITFEHKWGRWGGPIETIVETVIMAQEEMNKWTDKELKQSIRIIYKNRTEKIDDIKLLNSLKAYELPTIKEINIDINSYYAVPSLSLRFDKSLMGLGAARLTLIAGDKTRAEGLFKQAREHIGRYGRFGWYHGWIGIPLVFFLSFYLSGYSLSEFGLLVQKIGLSEHNGQFEAIESVEYIFRAWLIPVGLSFAIWWVMPTLELLSIDGKTRLQRFRIGIYALMMAFIVSIVTLIIDKYLLSK